MATPAERLAALVRCENPLMLARMRSGFAVLAETQFLPGYCLLLAYPQVDHLTDLSLDERAGYLLDMSILGEAVLRATSCRRINYSIYGNLDPFLHAHVIPRYESEPEEYRYAPPFSYPTSVREDPAERYDDSRHGELRARIEAGLRQLMKAANREP
jgi:diadenosine tetraphosphate (Ap4A) HIT family hydrolase